MVQSSRGWDKAPRSGWGVKPSAPSKGKGVNPLPGGPPGAAAFRDGFGASSPWPCLRTASPGRPPAGSHAPPAARTSPPLPVLVGPGRQLGSLRAQAAVAVGQAGARGAAGRCPSVGRRGPARGVAARPGPRGGRSRPRALGWGAQLCLVRPRRPPAIDRWSPGLCLLAGVAWTKRPRLPGCGGGPGGQCVNSFGWAGRRPRSCRGLVGSPAPVLQCQPGKASPYLRAT